MNKSLLARTLAVSLGLAGGLSSSLLAQNCDETAPRCKGAGKCCCRQCDDKGLLDVIGKVAGKVDAGISRRLADLAAVGRHSHCDGGACDALVDAHCPHCATHHAPTLAPPMVGHSAPETHVAPHSHVQPHTPAPLPIAPPAGSHSHSISPDSASPGANHLPPVVPYEVPMPPPINSPQLEDSKIDPFRDDNARSVRPNGLKARPAGYVRPKSAGDRTLEPAPANEPYLELFSPQASHSGRRSISDSTSSTSFVENNLSNGSSRRAFASRASIVDVAVDVVAAPNEPQEASPVVPASAMIPVQSAFGPQRPNRQVALAVGDAGGASGRPTPSNPLRAR